MLKLSLLKQCILEYALALSGICPIELRNIGFAGMASAL